MSEVGRFALNDYVGRFESQIRVRERQESLSCMHNKASRVPHALRPQPKIVARCDPYLR